MPLPALALLAVLAARATTRDTVPADSAAARADSAVRVRVGGFVDAYYAHDTNRPRALDRALSTTAARHAEFNLNLAFVEATLEAPRVRGRLALQAGTSVQANYAGEPSVGAFSGPSLSRVVQEGWAGYALRPGLWVDGGIFFAPFGAESWISRDNPIYMRSLIADNSPYYASGVRLSWQATPALQAQLQLLNGWQNVSETNQAKALALRLDWTPVRWATLTYDTFVGNEQPDSVPARTRQFHEVLVRLAPTPRTALTATFDYGRQPRPAVGSGNAGAASWRGFAVLARQQLAPRLALGARVEGYADPEQVIVATGTPAGLRVRGGSLNVDLALHPRALWRTEARTLRARAPIFPTRDGALARGDGVVVSSLALTF